MAKRIDENQREIVKAFRELGATVQILSNTGKGCPDILIGIHGCNYLVEIKNGSKPPSQRKLTDKEEIFFKNWKGHVCIINSVDDAIKFINELNCFTF